MKLLKAIYPPLITPFRNEEISYEDLKSNLTKYNKFELSGYIVGGSNGETVFLTKDEKLKLIGSVREHTSSNKQIIAGTGLESIKSTIELTNTAAEVGADFALIVTPHFFQNEMTHNAFINYYTAVADKIKIPLIIYNVTKFTGVNISADTIAKLAEHPNIVGIKNSNNNVDELKQIINTVSNDFCVMAGTGSVIYPALRAGAKGGVLALANVAPAECLEIYNLFNIGKLKEAEQLQSILIPVNKAITATYGVAGLKAAMDLVGFVGGNPRMPLEPLNENQKNDLKKTLTKASLIKLRN
ncbi:MAG: dihydrodipicolinate synthase family protein [Ignavibacteria bacterium]|nr:dihydrodipicolinate synthase family protein [Ignavibacteria bacterium]NNL22625.1 dihydrodipicolinate synthase family protein [Ignavibacteriaceae bacterium]